MNGIQKGPDYTVENAAAREQHHIRLQNSVNGMNEVIIQLRLLLDRIQNGNSNHPSKLASPSDGSVPVMESLATVLHSASDSIRKASDEQLSLIEAINEQLF